MELKPPWWMVPEHFAFPLEFSWKRTRKSSSWVRGSLPCPLLFSISLPPPQYIPGRSRSSSPCPSSLFAAVLRPAPPGHLAADLLRLGAHSQIFIQLEKGFAATGLTRVLLVASLESRQWLFLTVWSIGSWDPESRGRGV